MKRLLIIAAAATVMVQSCAKDPGIGNNDANRKFFESWIQIFHPDAKKDNNGLYILEDAQGNGAGIGDEGTNPYVYIHYTLKDLDGNIIETTEEDVAKQLGTYSESNYYGPQLYMRRANVMKAGLELLLQGMRVGGSRTAAIPGWFDTKERYKDENGYYKHVTGTDYIYSVKLEDTISDLKKYQIDSISSYLLHNFKNPVDSVMFGYYYIQTQAPSDTTTLDKTATVRINYTGRLLNGQVFDTTDENTAKDYHIYNSGRTYEPYEVELKEDYTDMDTVQGFSYCISHMKKGEKGICIFYSSLGYGGNAQTSIPPYSPLRFDIEMIGKK